MSSLAIVQEFVTACSKLQSLSALGLLLETVTEELGFGHFALIQHVDVARHTGEHIWLHTYPESFTQRPIESDPILMASHRRSLGFRWRDVGKYIQLTSRQKEVLAVATRFGIGDGFTVPTHIPGMVEGSCSFACRLEQDIQVEVLPVAQLIGLHAFEAARRMTFGPRQDVRVALTARQLDCVVHAARGKSDWEISRILGIAEDTVTEHLQEARRRYDVDRRMQLVMRAIHDGHLSVADTLH